MEKTKKRIRLGELVPALICVGLVLILIVVSFRNKYKEGDDWLVYAASLDKVAAEVNGQKLTLRDMAFYIAYDETVVEEQAELYDPEDTTKYWNLKTNNVFIRQLSKQNVMEKAIHDEIFYAMAVREEMELTSDDEIRLSEVQDMFWDNFMYGDKLERLGVTKND
ncbi:MAG: hypothetical protein K2M91_05660, partial [Lachnospiraceae bacterium]|nr:hypothetical protein [Lachnospiraceae bacterium]